MLRPGLASRMARRTGRLLERVARGVLYFLYRVLVKIGRLMQAIALWAERVGRRAYTATSSRLVGLVERTSRLFQPSGAPPDRFCTQCGNPSYAIHRFCRQCGSPLNGHSHSHQLAESPAAEAGPVEELGHS